MSYLTGKPSNYYNPNGSWIVADLEPVSVINNELFEKEKDHNHCFVYHQPKETAVTVHKDDEEERSKTKKSTAKLLAKFARTTSGHGFARIVDPQEKFIFRAFWAFVIFFFIVSLLVTISIISYEALVVRQQRREYIMHHNDTMFLPDIHICDTSLFKRSALRELGLNDTMASYMALTLSTLLASNSLKRNLTRRLELQREFDRITEGKTIEEIFSRAALRCEDIILSCVYATEIYSAHKCCKSFFGNERYVTDLATLCVSTHNQGRLEEVFPSQLYGFTAFIQTDIRGFEFDPSIISSNIASRRGVIYAISDPISAVSPTISAAGHYIPLDTWTSVSMTLTRTDNTELQRGVLSPQICVPTDSSEFLYLVPNHSVYSERNCAFASAKTIMEEKLNCTRFRFHHSGSLDVCHPDVMIDFYNADIGQEIKERANKCPEDCLYDEYHVSASTTHLSLGNHDYMHQNETHNDQYAHSAIQFFYPAFTFTIIKNHPQSLIKWLSDVGGNMSICLGASFVTLLEIMVLLGHCVWHYFY